MGGIRVVRTKKNYMDDGNNKINENEDCKYK